MYRIFFAPMPGKFVIQVLYLGFIWVNVKTEEDKTLVFETYDDALSHVTHIGLDRLYLNRSADAYRAHMAIN